MTAQYRAIAQLAVLRSLEPGVGQVHLHITPGDLAFWKGLEDILELSLKEVCDTVREFNVKVYFHVADINGERLLGSYLPRGILPLIINAKDFLGAGNTDALAQAQPPEVIAETPVAVRRGWWAVPSFSGLFKGTGRRWKVPGFLRRRNVKKNDSTIRL